MRVGLLEDDSHLAELMRLWMLEAGFDCQTYNDGKSFLRAISRESYDLLVIDWFLPDMNGDEVLTKVRANLDWPIPVLFVTRRDSEADIVRALELGADDYMTKPVRRGELIARMKALHRRGQGALENKEGAIELPPYRIDTNNRVISREDNPIDLTQKEFDLTLFLFRNSGRMLSRGHILESVWGQSEGLNTRTVDTHMSRIRSKLELTPEHGWRLSSIYQHGYRLERLEAEEQEAG